MSTHCHCPATPTVVPVGSIDLVLRHDQGCHHQENKPQCSMEQRLDALEKELEEALALAKKNAGYQLCEFYSFRNPQKKQGFELAHGELLENVADLYPEAWAFLQTDEGKALCVTEDEWQALTHATWATLADETKVGFDGIGGAPFYVQDLDAGTLRLPDIRGMYAEASGFDGLTVGGVHGDGIPPLTGELGRTAADNDKQTSGAFKQTSVPSAVLNATYQGSIYAYITDIDSSRVIPSSKVVQPRAFGVLPCVYLGNSK